MFIFIDLFDFIELYFHHTYLANDKSGFDVFPCGLGNFNAFAYRM